MAKKKSLIADSATNCLDVPPYPAGAGPGCLLWGDGERLHWTDPPTGEGQTPVWNGKEWVLANPAGLTVPKNGPPKNGPADQPM